MATARAENRLWSADCEERERERQLSHPIQSPHKHRGGLQGRGGLTAPHAPGKKRERERAFVWLVTAMSETEKDPSPPKCRRCREGPSFHGGHERGDPECQLHGCFATAPADIQFFPRAKAIETTRKNAVKEAEDSMSRGLPLLDEDAGQPQGIQNDECLCERCIRGPCFHGARNRKAPNCVFYGAGGVTAPRVKEHLLIQEFTAGQGGHPPTDADGVAKPTC